MKPRTSLAGCAAALLALTVLSASPIEPGNSASGIADPAYAMMQQAVAGAVVADAARVFGLGSPQHCLANEVLAVCLHPDTPPERVDEILRSLPTWDGGDKYQLGQRWTSTAMDGSTGGSGNPINLTYSFVDDGVWIPGGSGEPGSANRLYAVMNQHFGSEAVWKPLFADMFNDWGSHCGITYHEVADDGAAFPGSAGAVGLRGDVRISSHSVDGAQGVLAYNYFPNVGDMVLDSSENWGAATNHYRYMRNIVRHEHGHGFGLQHVTPENCSKLMEAFACTNFDGPQDDDLRGSMRLYGDVYERNNTVETASDLGTVSGTFALEHPAAVTSSVDFDYYRFTTSGPAVLGVTLDPVGSRYLLEGVFVQTDEIMNLAFQVLGGPNGSEVLATVNDVGLGGTEVLAGFALPAAGDYWLYVYRAGGLTDLQRYDLALDVQVDDLTAAPDQGLLARGAAATLAPNPFNPRTVVRFQVETPGPYALDVYDVSGRLVRHLRGTAVAGWNEQAWDGRGDRGEAMPSGTYLMRIRAGEAVQFVRGLLLE